MQLDLHIQLWGDIYFGHLYVAWVVYKCNQVLGKQVQREDFSLGLDVEHPWDQGHITYPRFTFPLRQLLSEM